MVRELLKRIFRRSDKEDRAPAEHFIAQDERQDLEEERRIARHKARHMPPKH